MLSKNVRLELNSNKFGEPGEVGLPIEGDSLRARLGRYQRKLLVKRANGITRDTILYGLLLTGIVLALPPGY